MWEQHAKKRTRLMRELRDPSIAIRVQEKGLVFNNGKMKEETEWVVDWSGQWREVV